MRLPTLFRLPKYYVFDYKPRYWNPKKEELESRIREAKQELEPDRKKDYSNYVTDIKGKMRSKMSPRYRTERRRAAQGSNIRFLIILLILVGVAYYLLFV